MLKRQTQGNQRSRIPRNIAPNPVTEQQEKQKLWVHQDSKKKRVSGHIMYHIIKLYIILSVWYLRSMQFYISLTHKAESY